MLTFIYINLIRVGFFLLRQPEHEWSFQSSDEGGKFLTLCETNNEPTFRLHQKIDKIEKKYRKLFLAQIGMKQEMSQFLDNTKKIQKIEHFLKR